MPRTDNTSVLTSTVQQLLATGDEAPSLEQKRQLLRALREITPDQSEAAITEVFRGIERMASSLRRAGAITDELRSKIEELVGKLWFPATFIGFHGEPEEKRALVSHGNTSRVVGIWEDVPVEILSKGCEVMLNHELSAIVARSSRPCRPTGEIVSVVEKTPRGSLIIRSREEEYEVELAGALAEAEFKAGDRVRWDPVAAMVFERVEQPQQRRFLLGETPNVTIADVGGQDENVARLYSILASVLVAPERAAAYGLSGRSSVLITGLPGCGKTLMVRAVVNEISRKTGKTARFFVVKPSEWESSLVGATERNIRETFATLREAAKDGSLVVLFLDEIEGIGRTRGYAHNQFADKALACLLAELDGFSGREGVAIIANTNRKELIDNALLSRLSDQEIHVLPPGRRGAEDIFGIHLKPTLPFCPNGTMAAATRRQLIETAVARIYAPNSPYAELCRIKFRDGKTTRLVSGRDFANGRLFEQICRAALQAAFQRELATGQSGITVADMEDAIAAAMERMSTALSVHNVRNFFLDLPADLDVIAVERLGRKVDRPTRYLSA